jgi:hypothetical protein
MDPPPTFMSDHFHRKEETVEAFVRRVNEVNKTDQLKAQELVQDALLSGVMNPLIGIYSKYHEIAVYKHGYGSP